jgi:hypothetical protein
MTSKKRTGKARLSGKRAQKDLTARKASATGGDQSDLGNALQIKLQESNNILTPAPPTPPPPPPPRTIRIR